jgi:hypothetical protein
VSEPTPRQVLYALVAGGFVLVVSIFVAGAAVAGIVPAWWTITMTAFILVFGVWGALNWRKTVPVLLGSIGLFVVWTVGTLIVG